MLAIALAAALAFAPKAKLPRVEFDPATVQWAQAKGTARLSGQAFLRTRGGDVKTCAGGEVYLVPDSPYGRYRMQLLFGGLDRGFVGTNLTFAQLEAVDPDFEPYVRTSICDAQGRFTFSRLPAGRYYIVAGVVWEIAAGRLGRLEPQGGRVMRAVELSVGDDQTTVVSW